MQPPVANDRLAARLNDEGIALARQGRRAEAEQTWREAIRLCPHYPKPYRNLALLLMDLSRFAEAAPVLERLARLDPRSAQVHFDLGTSLLHSGQAARAIEPLKRCLALDAGHGAAMANLGLALEEVGERADAIDMLAAAKALLPSSPIIDFHLGALGGCAAPARCPADYLTALFDQYAPRFDQDLVGRLKYCAPDEIATAVADEGVGESSVRVLDLGCGTGLCGQSLRRYATTLVGVDLSPNMIATARATQRYDELFLCDVLDAMGNWRSSFDLIVAADVLIYIGDLASLFHLAFAALLKGGLFIFTIETTQDGDYTLRETRRYAHSPAYVRRLARETGFTESSASPLVLRTPPPVDGLLFVLRTPH